MRALGLAALAFAAGAFAAPTFTPVGSMDGGREFHTATPLPNGKVLIAGGWNSSAGYFSACELYDPATGTFAPTGSVGSTRDLDTAMLLGNVNRLAPCVHH